MKLLKTIAARLPHRWQSELKRIHFGRQIARDSFNTSEAEYQLLPQLVQAGDWVIDVGANVGQYTKRLSDLVGANGRVFAFEPVPTTFAILAANAELFKNANVTLINAAVSEQLDVVGMSIPRFATGLDNYYEAHLVSGAEAGVNVVTIAIDTLNINRRIALIKIDAEGHEASVLAGMSQLLSRFMPALIVETTSPAVISRLQLMGYQVDRKTGSSNVVCIRNQSP